MDIKRVLTMGLAVASTVVAAVCAFGWYGSANWGTEESFSSCKDLGGELELTYSHGTGDTVRVTQKPDGQDVTLSYRVKTYEGQARDAMGNSGRLRLGDLGGKVYDPDGQIIECAQVDSSEN